MDIRHQPSIPLDAPPRVRTGLVNQELQLRNEYLVAENRILQSPSAVPLSLIKCGSFYAGVWSGNPNAPHSGSCAVIVVPPAAPALAPLEGTSAALLTRFRAEELAAETLSADVPDVHG